MYPWVTANIQHRLNKKTTKFQRNLWKYEKQNQKQQTTTLSQKPLLEKYDDMLPDS